MESLDSADDERCLSVLYLHGRSLICVEGAGVSKCDKELQSSVVETVHLSVSSDLRKVHWPLLT